MPLIEVFGRSFSTYALFGILGMFAASGVMYIRARKHGFIFMDIAIGVLVVGAGIVIGGTLLHVFTQAGNAWAAREFFTTDPLAFIRRYFGGMVFYGGLFGAVATLPIYAKVIKRDALTILGLLVPVLPLAHAIMRVGCFMAGCCFGVASDTFGLVFANSPIAPNHAVVPTQLIEVGANLIFFVVLWIYSTKPRPPLRLLGLYGVMYAVMRFSLEFFRGDSARGFIFGLSTSQFVSIGVLAVSLILIHRRST